jgi:hypothetical protein
MVLPKTSRSSRAVLNGCFRRSIGATANERLTSPLIRLQPGRLAHSQSGRASPWSRSGSARPQSRAFQERISASRRNGNGPISPSRGRRRRWSGRFRSLRFGRPIPKSPATFARDRPRAKLPSATPRPPFEGSSGARRIYQCPGMTRMAWKFQPPSGID